MGRGADGDGAVEVEGDGDSGKYVGGGEEGEEREGEFSHVGGSFLWGCKASVAYWAGVVKIVQRLGCFLHKRMWWGKLGAPMISSPF